MIVAGAVNGQPATLDVTSPGSTHPETFPDSDNGVASTLSVETDGAGFGTANGRVASICGTTSGRDHFPFPIPDASVGDTGSTTVHPFSLAAADACFCYWRVRKWHAALSVSYVGGGATLDFDFALKKAPGAYTTYFLPTGESDLVIGPGQFSQFFNISANGTGAVDGSYRWDISNVVNGGDGGMVVALLIGFDENMVWDGALFPELAVEISTGNAVTDDYGSGTVTVGTLQLNGLAAAVIGTTDFTTRGNPGDAASASAVISPIEFWPYSTKAGALVYDTATGAQLAGPFL